MGLRRFFISPEGLGQERPEITGADAGHILKVLRLTINDVVELFDGAGNGCRARIIETAPQKVVFAIEAPVAQQGESPVHVTLAQGMLKDRKMDDLLRHLTELGIDCWMPFYASRSVPSPGSKGLEKRLTRWRKIAVEAVKQCRRGRIPEILPARDLGDVLAASESCDRKILFWEERNRGFDLPSRAARRVMIVVGPEGGFDPREVRQAKDRGFLTAGLGPRILRAETATLAAMVLVQYCLGDMGSDSPAMDPSAAPRPRCGGRDEKQ